MATDTPVDQIPNIVASARTSFNAGITRPLEWRKQQLNGIWTMVNEHKKELFEALRVDLGRPNQETELGEIFTVETAIKETLKNLSSWTAPRAVSTPIVQLKGLTTSQVVPEPKGVVLCITPWNYPISLPLIGVITALSAGNSVILKPSEIAEKSAEFLVNFLPQYVDTRCIKVVPGAVPQTTALLTHRFDHIHYTGNGQVARIIMRAAAEFLTPVTLELGGKSPVFVDKDVDLEVAARRVAWGKCFNAGQTCIACDYVLVHEQIKEKFLEQLKIEIGRFYGVDPKISPDFARIVSARHFQRLVGLLEDTRKEDANAFVLGGDTEEATRYIAPTIVAAKPDSSVMRAEIFGPILPVLGVHSIDDAIAFINERPKPLALYIFTKTAAVWQRLIDATSSGGVCVNDTLMQYAVATLPFGGVGESGIGVSHGQAGFDEVSHLKSVLNKTTWFDLDIRYPPYSDDKVKMFNRLNI